jgi:hypothetical protein
MRHILTPTQSPTHSAEGTSTEVSVDQDQAD